MSSTVIITGNMGKPAELKYTNSGKPVIGFPLADTPRRKNEQTGQWEDAGETLWLDVSMWGEDAEQLAEQMRDFKGRVTVVGRLGARSYEKDGQKRVVTTLTATAVMPHPKRADRAQGGSQTQQQADPWATPQQTSWGSNAQGQPYAHDEAPW